jgi:hypothetical protein
VNQEEADDILIHTLGSPSMVARWEQWKVARKEYQDREAAFQAQFDALPQDEACSLVADALGSATEVLRTTPIDDELSGHGWTPALANGLADHCERLRSMVEAGTYPREWGGSGLWRWMSWEVDARTTDPLHEAVNRAQKYLKALSSRS